MMKVTENSQNIRTTHQHSFMGGDDVNNKETEPSTNRIYDLLFEKMFTFQYYVRKLKQRINL